LQQENFEGPANIAKWALSKNHEIKGTMVHQGERLPLMNDFDMLVIMGGSMNVYEDKKYPWLKDEKKFIERAIFEDKHVLGICLGSQLISDVLGGLVYKNAYKEIGWFDVSLTGEGKNSSVFKGFTDKFTVFQWHGDTFDIPPGCKHIAESVACKNQAFTYGDKTLGLQFHLETSEESVKFLVDNCRNEIVQDRYIQSIDEMYEKKSHSIELYRLMLIMMDNLTGY